MNMKCFLAHNFLKNEVVKMNIFNCFSRFSMHFTAQHSTAQHSTAQHSTAQHSTAQHPSTSKK
jgi:hypothetical protein